MVLGLGLILALIGAQGGPVSGQRSARALSEAATRPPAYVPMVETKPDPLCNSRLIDLGAQVVSVSGVPALSIKPGGVTDPIIDGPSVLLPTLKAVPESLRAELEAAEDEAEQWFRYFLSSARIPYAFHFGPRAGHSYGDLGSQDHVLSSMVPQRQIRIARSLLLRFIHLWDDFVDMVDDKAKLKSDISKSAEDLMREHEPRIFEVWTKIDQFIRDRFPLGGYDPEALLFGVRRTAYASLMFSSTPTRRGADLRAGYKILLLQRLPENSRIRRFIGTLNEKYVANTSKVLLEAFDGPFKLFYPRPVRNNLRGLSYLMELLYVPALAKQNESVEIESGEIGPRSRLTEQEAGDGLIAVMNKIKSLPQSQRQFVVRNLPLFIEKYEMILKKKKVLTPFGRRSLFDVYNDFMQNDAIKPFVSASVIYQEALLHQMRRNSVQILPFGQ